MSKGLDPDLGPNFLRRLSADDKSCSLSKEILCQNCKNFRNFGHSECRVPQLTKGVVECLTRDREAAGLSLTGVTALWSLSKTHLSWLSTGSTQEDPSLFN